MRRWRRAGSPPIRGRPRGRSAPARPARTLAGHGARRRRACRRTYHERATMPVDAPDRDGGTVAMTEDEFVLDAPAVRGFISEVRAAIGSSPTPEQACAALRRPFERLLADPDWLPQRYCEPAPESGMGGGIGQWLLYRAGDRSLSLFSLVVPPGVATPVHDHLAWGLVGLYRGTQDEEIYAPGEDSIELAERRALRPGDLYALLPPRDDVQRVRTTSPETSVSIHLLTNDTGCVWRHTYDPASGEA